MTASPLCARYAEVISRHSRISGSKRKLTFTGGLHIMEKIIISENQRGLLFKNGKFVKLLSAGKYRVFGDSRIEVKNLSGELSSALCPLETLLTDKEIEENTTVMEVKDCQVALHYVNGKFFNILSAGKYAFWTVFDKHEFTVVDCTSPYVDSSIPSYVIAKYIGGYFIEVSVAEYQRARLYFNKRFERLLDPGTYFFWKNDIKVETEYVDIRLTQMNISGQELMTRDKVSLRVNLTCSYRVTDCIRIAALVNDFEEQLHVAAQLALREYIGRYSLDEILENKDRMSEYVFEKLRGKEEALYVEIADAGVKDIILPGEIRDIMNTVLVAEKRAQANVITRREEVASTRSLLNTAKLMDENRTLYKLKELEFVERICENVGNISLNANGDILSQLTGILRGDTP